MNHADEFSDLSPSEIRGGVFEQISKHLMLVKQLHSNDSRVKVINITGELLEILLRVEGALDDFCNALRQNSKVTLVEILCSRFIHSSRIHESDTDNLMQCWSKIGEALGRMPQLKDVDFHNQGDKVVPVFYEAIPCILQHTRQVTRIEFDFEIDFWFDADGIHFLVDANAGTDHIVASLKGHSNAEEVQITNCSGDKASAICAVLPSLPKLRFVQIYGHDCPALARDSFSSLFQVHELSVLLLDNFEIESTEPLADAIRRNVPLSSCEFCSCILFPNDDVSRALASNTHLKSLVFSESGGLCDDFYTGLSQGLAGNSSLTTLLMLDDDQCTDNGSVLNVIEGLRNSNSIKEISLPLSEGPWTDEMSDSLRTVLERNTVLTSLKVRFPDIDTVLDTGLDTGRPWSRIAPFLRTSTTIKELCLLGPITDDCLVETAMALEDNTGASLASVDIQGTDKNVTVSGIVRFISTLTSNTSLNELVVSLDTKFVVGTQAASALVEAAAKNYGLEKAENVTISSRQDDSKLKCIFKLNKEGRRYLIEDPSSVERGVGVLTGVSDDLDCIFFHLRENPTLCTRTTIENNKPRLCGQKRKQTM
jgi:hypothetical protein